MGLFIPEDHSYDVSVRQTGFKRYKQLLSLHFGNWWKINLITLAGFMPLAFGILYALLASSTLILLPASILGGMIAGPFLAGLYDAIYRGLRDDPNNVWKNYRRSWKQNWKGSLIPGALTGLMIGLFAFMGMLLFWWAETAPTPGTVLLYLFSFLLLLVISMLYWPQLVLFDQSVFIRLKNCMLFVLTYFWRVMAAALLQLAYWVIHILFAPWTALLLPFSGIWYIIFLSQFLIYEKMDEALHIEEAFRKNNEADPA